MNIKHDPPCFGSLLFVDYGNVIGGNTDHRMVDAQRIRCVSFVFVLCGSLTPFHTCISTSYRCEHLVGD